jgi:hypothetical protein
MRATLVLKRNCQMTQGGVIRVCTQFREFRNTGTPPSKIHNLPDIHRIVVPDKVSGPWTAEAQIAQASRTTVAPRVKIAAAAQYDSNITYSLFLLMFVIQTATSSPSYPQKLANQLVTYENTGREILSFFSEANEPLLLFISGLIIFLIATRLKSELARKPS